MNCLPVLGQLVFSYWSVVVWLRQNPCCTSLPDVMKRITTDPWKYLKRIDNGIGKGNLSLDNMEYPNFPDNCWTLDVEKQTNSTVGLIVFYFKPDPTYSAEIFVEDKLLSLKRASSFSKFSTDGPRIENADAMFKGYALQIEQEIYDEKDEKFGCRNYPTDLYPTYQDCDKEFVRKWIENHTPNLVPVWASKSQNDTTTLTKDGEVSNAIGKFFMGTKRTGCPLPCKTTKISVR